MKKLLLLLLVTTSFFISANREKLENAIMESDLTAVRSLLKSTTLDEDERYSLFKLSQMIIAQRYRDSIFPIFLSKADFLNVLKGAGVSIAVAMAGFALYKIKLINVRYEEDALIPGGFTGLASIIAVVLKHFYDIRKLLTNAMAITALLEKKEDTENRHKHDISIN